MSRRYTEAELRAILAKAVEEGGSEPHEGIDGLSLAEIKEIGAEVGIDADTLERAARLVAPGHAGRWAGFAGAPTAMSVERRVEGELDSVQMTEILSVIRSGMGKPGRVSELKGLLEWRSSGELGHRVITLSSDDGVTTVGGMADLTQAAVITHLPASLIGLMGSAVGFMVAANAGNEIGMVFFVALVPTLLLTLRRLFARLSRSECGKLESVVEELAVLVGDSDRDGPDSTGATQDQL